MGNNTIMRKTERPRRPRREIRRGERESCNYVLYVLLLLLEAPPRRGESRNRNFPHDFVCAVQINRRVVLIRDPEYNRGNERLSASRRACACPRNKGGTKNFFRQLSHRNAAFLPFSMQFFCVFLHRRRWRSLPAAPDPIPKSESATMNRENKAVAASESSEAVAAGPKRAFQLVESRSCCRRNTWDGREKERRIGSDRAKQKSR